MASDNDAHRHPVCNLLISHALSRSAIDGQGYRAELHMVVRIYQCNPPANTRKT